jgi:ABC-type uncharacterized transport system substrate-binding protein
MRRRDFISFLGGAAGFWPSLGRADKASLPVIGFLSSASPGLFAPLLFAFRQGLLDAGYIENKNFTIEYRWAENRYDRLPGLATELIDRGVAVIVATGGPVTAIAVKGATKTIPFVFVSGVDPIKLGLVASLNRPGGNATGVNLLITAIESKRLAILHELIPSATQIAVMVNPNSPEIETQLSDVQSAGRAIGCRLEILQVGTEDELDAAFTNLVKSGCQGLLVAGDPFFNSSRERIVRTAADRAIPAIYEARTYVVDGGLMSYGPNLVEMYRQLGLYTGQILKGAKPADLPVIQPTSLALVINLKAAKALGLTVPPMLLARADEVIE